LLMGEERVTPDYVRARWAYSELLSIEQGHKYQRKGTEQLRDKARQGVLFDELDQREQALALAAWHDVRGGFDPLFAGISAFRLVHWTKDDLAGTTVIPYFVRDVVSDHLIGFVRIPVTG
jgi:hypothetical protein